ncbi:hypothetical protein CQ14_03050 [Bradyrhizobium lablabi]|uniref:Uncharacterized protein n=1 Tax=Bradyrhizobium lablabi TaxID=722472 RepID=A0A0R3N869_9BRAD|nr:hypothetical protein [Bradyrhizobium lablabi]KRR26479.1 hypothetical protein CQ14_03050 [Bradyrhizobium lablabi]
MTDILNLPNVPEAARDRIQDLRDVAGDKRAALVSISRDRTEAWVAKASAEARMAEIKRHSSGFLNEAEPPLSQLLEVIAHQGAIVRRCDKRTAEIQPGYEAASRLLASLENYISANAARLVLYEGAAPRLQDGETAIDALERAGRRSRALQADRTEVLSAPLPSALVKQIALAELKARAEAAAPDVFALIEQGGQIEFPTIRMATEQYGAQQPVHVFGIDPIGTLAWLFPKEFQTAIGREIDAASDDAAALSPEQRKAKVAQIDADILASARDEARFATLAGVLPREDCDPRAVLGLADHCPAPEAR